MSFNIFVVLPIVVRTLPLILLVLIAIIYAAMNREAIGRPAVLVMYGGGLVLLSLLASLSTNILLVFQMLNFETLSIITGISGFVTMVISTIGWGMILYAVFVDRKTSGKLDF